MKNPKENVFAWLDVVRERPTMYLCNRSVRELEVLLSGYYSCLEIHNIIEPVPQMYWHFLMWVYHRTGWSCSAGWAAAIEQRHPDPSEALAAFFDLVDEYRHLRPQHLCTVQLSDRHNPSGERVRYGFDGLMEKPRQVDIVRYAPEPLHFLRFHYPDRVEDSHLLTTDNGEYSTTLRTAKQWVRDELQVEFSEWEDIGKSRRNTGYSGANEP